MRKLACTLAFLLLPAAPALAQTSEFGILIGGSKRLISQSDQAQGRGVSDNFKFSNSVREIYYGVQLDPGTNFKLKAGEIEGPAAFQYQAAKGPARIDIPKGKVEHIDALVDYRFSEPFGSTGIFAGVGLYRQRGDITDTVVPADQRGQQTETNYGFSGGVNGDFPISRRLGFVAEATYHWMNFNYRTRYVTLSGGLRLKF